MKWELADKALDSSFQKAVEKISGVNVSECYQCGKCSGGCPVAPEVKVSPNRAIRLVQLGLRDEALSSDLVWHCAGCGTCTGRCPEGVDIGRVLDALRAIAEHRGLWRAPGALQVRTFYRAFLDSVHDFGRLSEVGLMGGYNINSGRILTNMVKAPWFFLKNKISMTAHPVKRIDRLQRAFERIKAIEEAELSNLGGGE